MTTVMPNDTATKYFKEGLVVRKPNIILTRVNSRHKACSSNLLSIMKLYLSIYLPV